jgi:hypothetical protein
MVKELATHGDCILGGALGPMLDVGGVESAVGNVTPTCVLSPIVDIPGLDVEKKARLLPLGSGLGAVAREFRRAAATPAIAAADDKDDDGPA